MFIIRFAAPLLALPFTFAASNVVAAAPPAPPFPVLRFFEGRTEGQGTLKIALSAPKSIRVQSRGRTEPDGTLVLVQNVEEAGKPSRTRTWRIREQSPGRFSGTLSDASGPVTARANGNRLQISYRMKGGFDVSQTLTLQPGGRSARNLMTVRKFGLPVGKLEETIRKLD